MNRIPRLQRTTRVRIIWGLYAIVPKILQSIDIGLFEYYHACGRRLPPNAAKRPLCARPTAISESTTYRNVVYRLSPGDAATANLLLGIRDACRFAWNEIKEAREIQYEHACGRKIESPTFFTLGTAFKTLWDQTEWLRKHSYTIVRDTLHYQADAWTAFFEGRAGYPKWKHRYSNPSFTIPENIRIRDSKLAVPKVGWLSIRRRGGNPYPAGQGGNPPHRTPVGGGRVLRSPGTATE